VNGLNSGHVSTARDLLTAHMMNFAMTSRGQDRIISTNHIQLLYKPQPFTHYHQLMPQRKRALLSYISQQAQ